MNIVEELDESELTYLVWQLQNSTSPDLQSRRAADAYLNNLSDQGTDFKMLMAVIRSGAADTIRLTASIYLKQKMQVNLKLTEYPLEILRFVEDSIVGFVKAEDYESKQVIINNVAQLLKILYTQRHW